MQLTDEEVEELVGLLRTLYSLAEQDAPYVHTWSWNDIQPTYERWDGRLDAALKQKENETNGTD